MSNITKITKEQNIEAHRNSGTLVVVGGKEIPVSDLVDNTVTKTGTSHRPMKQKVLREKFGLSRNEARQVEYDIRQKAGMFRALQMQAKLASGNYTLGSTRSGNNGSHSLTIKPAKPVKVSETPKQKIARLERELKAATEALKDAAATEA